MALRIRFLKCYSSGELFFFLLSVNEEVTSTKVVTFVITCEVILGKGKLSIFTAWKIIPFLETNQRFPFSWLCRWRQ